MSDADLIRGSVRILDVLEMLDLQPPDSAGKIRSWLRDETKPSVQIYDAGGDRDNWFDFGAGVGGDVIDLVQSFFGCSFGKACLFLSSAVDEGLVPRVHVRTEKTPIDLWPRFMQESLPLNDEADQFIVKTWGWPASDSLTRARFDVRQANGALWIAHWGPYGDKDHHAVLGVKVRAYTGARFALEGSIFTSELYHSGSIIPGDPDVRTAVITEGEPDTWTLTELLWNKAHVFGLPSGAGTWKDSWLEQLKGYEHVVVCLDNDEAGIKGMNQVSNALHKLSSEDNPLVIYHPAFPGKDISDAVRLHGYDPVKEWNL